MSERFTKFKRVTSASLAIVFLALQAPLGLFGTPKAAATFAREDKVTYSYCYVAGTDTYIQKSAEGKDLFDAYFKNGNSRPGDIIPEFTYLGKKYSQSWSLENQIIHGNDCKVPKGTVEVSKKVDTDADGKYVDANGKFSDFRWGFSDETPARLMGSDADVKVGTYAVNEKAVNGYKFVGWYYTGVHGKSCATPNGTTLPISVNVTKNVTTKVTVCNQRTTGSITIVKDAQPNAIDDFKFEIDRNNSSWDEDFTLDDDTNNAYSNTKTYNKLPTATYVITEKMTPAQANTWKLSDIACEGAQVTKTAAAVTINLSADQNVTCTFVNQKRGKITVNKETVGANTGIFSVTASGIGAIDGTAARLINAGGSVTYVVDQGTYTIAEQDKDGWLENATGCQSVVVSANDLEKTCTIVNTKAAKLQIKKQTRDSASSNQSFNFTTTGAGLDDFDLKGNESKSFTEL
ncbi:MAG: hypothetical protein JWL85_919, partial [Candidatus Saccharibacteria bacterium]|nr:hypothetical protein [Candidatus Saccharibacteria bacterium]